MMIFSSKKSKTLYIANTSFQRTHFQEPQVSAIERLGCIYFTSQKYTVNNKTIIIKHLQYTYKTLKFKITAFLQLRLHGEMTQKKSLLLAGACRKTEGFVTKHLCFLSVFPFSLCLKEAQFFKFKYLTSDFTFKEMLQQQVFSVLFKKLFHITGPRALRRYLA